MIGPGSRQPSGRSGILLPSRWCCLRPTGYRHDSLNRRAGTCPTLPLGELGQVRGRLTPRPHSPMRASAATAHASDWYCVSSHLWAAPSLRSGHALVAGKHWPATGAAMPARPASPRLRRDGRCRGSPQQALSHIQPSPPEDGGISEKPNCRGRPQAEETRPYGGLPCRVSARPLAMVARCSAGQGRPGCVELASRVARRPALSWPCAPCRKRLHGRGEKIRSRPNKKIEVFGNLLIGPPRSICGRIRGEARARR